MNTQDFIVRAASLRGRFGIAFGAERLALVPFRTPAATVLIALVLAVLAVLGIDRIRIDDSLSQLFHSESPAFKLFEQVSHDFPSSEYDEMIVVTGDNLLDRDSVEKLRSLVTDVQLIEGTRGVLSMFSARQPAPGGGLPEPIFSGALAARIGLPSTCRAGAAQGHHPRQAAVDRRPTGASQVRQRERE